MKETDASKLDIRTRERLLRNGTLSKEDLQKHLKSLPDESKNAEEVAVFEETGKEEEAPTFSV